MAKETSPVAQGSAIIPLYNYATGQYMLPMQYGENMNGLEMQPDNRQTRMGNRIVNAKSPHQPNYMIGNGNSPMSRGGANMFASPIEGYRYLTTGGYPPPSAMPQNANIYPAMFNHQTGDRIDPQSSNGLIDPVFKDKHSSDMELGMPMFSGTPDYLKPNFGASLSFVDVTGGGGYKYRLFSDGRIMIVSVNGVPSNRQVPTNSSAYNAIIAQVGTYQQNVGSSGSSSAPVQTGNRFLDQGQQFLQSDQGQNLLNTVFNTFLSKQGAKQSELDLQAQQAEAQRQEIARSMETPAWKKALPYLAVIGVIGAATTVVVNLNKGKKK